MNLRMKEPKGICLWYRLNRYGYGRIWHLEHSFPSAVALVAEANEGKCKNAWHTIHVSIGENRNGMQSLRENLTKVEWVRD